MFASINAAQHSATKNSGNASRRRFIHTMAGGMILAATGPSLVGCKSPAQAPESATEAWRVTESDDSLIRWGLSYAILAPNPHNMQPWLVDLSIPGEMLVFLDPTRLLPETDPFGRQIMIGTGAMLGLFELALATKGYAVDVQWIGESEDIDFLSVKEQQPLVRVTVTKNFETIEAIDQLSLFDHIRNRRTVRANYDLTRPPTPEFVSSLANFSIQDQSLGVIDRELSSPSFNRIADWVKEAWRIELSTPQTSSESMRLLRIGRKEINKHRDGIAIESTFLWLMSTLGLLDRNQPLAVGSSGYNRQIDEFNQSVDCTPSWFYITSDSNRRVNQLEVGRTYIFAQLKATELGLVMHPVSQGLQEYKEMTLINDQITTELNQVTGRSGQTVQMLARIGYLPEGEKSPRPAPRRGVDWHIVTA